MQRSRFRKSREFEVVDPFDDSHDKWKLQEGSRSGVLGKVVLTLCCLGGLIVATKLAMTFVPAMRSGDPEAAFIQWLSKEGAVVEGVTLSHFGDEFGRGVLATMDIPRDALMLTLPAHLLMERSRIMRNSETHEDIVSPTRGEKADSARHARRQAYAKLANKGDEVLLSAYLLEQTYLGTRSKWSAYIAVLPEGAPVAINWSEADLIELQDAQQESTCRRTRDATMMTFHDVRPLFFRVLKASQTLIGRKDDDHELIPFCEPDFYMRVQSLVSSRALSIEGRRVLAPLADMFNYESTGESRPNESGANFLKYHRWDSTGDGSLRIFSERTTAAGAQVFEDYGDNPNHIYLQYHGFVPDENPFECVVVELPPIQEIIKTAREDLPHTLTAQGPFAWLRTAQKLSDAAAERRKKALGVAPRMCVGSDVDINRKDVYLGVRYLLTSMVAPSACNDETEKDLQKLQDCLRKNMGSAAEPGVAWLRGFARRKLRQYPTRYGQDAVLLQSAMTPEHRVAIRYRMGQKRVLHELLNLDLHDTDFEDTSNENLSAASETKVGSAMEGAQPLRSRIDLGCQDIGTAVKTFNDWMDKQGAPTYNVRAMRDDKYRVGAMAVRPLAVDKVYLAVPEKVIMSVDSALQDGSDARDAIVAMRQRFGKGDPFHELLLHLIYERFVERENSYFWPYLQLLPQPGEQLSSLSFPKKVVEAFRPSTAWIDIDRYQKRVKDTYTKISKIPEIQEFLSEDIFTYEHYEWAHAILDSRSIWWNGERHLVPLLDLVNCQEGPNKKRVHVTKWDSSTRSAVTRADRPYQAGEQVFENYGQPNKVYMIYHGFILENNPNDFLEIDLYLSLYEDSPKTQEVLRRSNLREGHNRFAIGGSMSNLQGEDYTPVSDRMEELMDLKYGHMSEVSRMYALILREVLPLSKIYSAQAGDDEDPSLAKFIKLIEDDGILLGEWNAAVTPRKDIQIDPSLHEVRKLLRSELKMLIGWMEEVANLYLEEKRHEASDEEEDEEEDEEAHESQSYPEEENHP